MKKQKTNPSESSPSSHADNNPLTGHPSTATSNNGAEKELKSIQSGLLSRTFSFGKLAVRAGSSLAGQFLQNKNMEAGSEDLKKFLIEQALMLNRELGKLKGTALKAGQMLSVYGEHFLPP